MEKIDIIKLEAERLAWSKEKFPEATDVSSIKKLIGEAGEILQDLRDGKREPHEYADCLMCLFDSAGRQKIPITPEDIFKAFAEKFEINKDRTWVKNADNTYSHVKTNL